jgi:hypothetical protein
MRIRWNTLFETERLVISANGGSANDLILFWLKELVKEYAVVRQLSNDNKVY